MDGFGDALSTALTSQSEGLPSIFEVKAQDSLNESVRPAIKHVIKILAQNAPQHFGPCFAWFDELYTILELLLQHHFLKNHMASFAEYYYDLQRKPLAKIKHGCVSPVGVKLHVKSLAALALFPYLQLKIEEKYNQIKEAYELDAQNRIPLLKKIFYWIYPFLHGTWNAAILYYNFMFAVGESEFHSPIYKALQLKLIISGESTAFSKKSNLSSRLFTNFLTGGVHVFIFAIQFVKWWYSEENNSIVKQATQLPIPEPPGFKTEDTLIPVPEKGICPMCQRKTRNEAALMTSGHVFCYTCIYKYVKANKRCPVTGYLTNTSHLIKVYLSA